MKRILSHFGMIAALMLAVQPLQASLSCAAGTPAACAPACPMAMDGMGADCPLAHPMATTDCPQSCCQHAQPTATTLAASPEKHKIAAILFAEAVPVALVHGQPAQARLTFIAVRGSPPPIYLLNRVFRI